MTRLPGTKFSEAVRFGRGLIWKHLRAGFKGYLVLYFPGDQTVRIVEASCDGSAHEPNFPKLGENARQAPPVVREPAAELPSR
jgi:hypothetical protein